MEKLSAFIVCVLMCTMFVGCEKEHREGKSCHCVSEVYMDGKLATVSETDYDNIGNVTDCSQINSNTTTMSGSGNMQVIVKCQ